MSDNPSVTADRGHLSIGEVLTLLQAEFPDVTISKIRFLESQGLLDPERTPSGYRKFYAPDIDRLRWVLRQQREHFLPLKVIKDRLAEHGPEGCPPDTPPPTVPAAGAPTEPVAAPAVPPVAEVVEEAGGQQRLPSMGGDAGLLDAGATSVSMTTEELLAASGLRLADLRDLERYGLLAGRPMGAEVLYDGEALVVARLAAGFMKFGVEARHLRMYRTSAEREAGFFEQVVMPMMKQRNPASRRRAVETLAELAQLGEGMRAAMLRHALRSYAGH